MFGWGSKPTLRTCATFACSLMMGAMRNIIGLPTSCLKRAARGCDGVGTADILCGLSGRGVWDRPLDAGRFIYDGGVICRSIFPVGSGTDHARVQITYRSSCRPLNCMLMSCRR